MVKETFFVDFLMAMNSHAYLSSTSQGPYISQDMHLTGHTCPRACTSQACISWACTSLRVPHGRVRYGMHYIGTHLMGVYVMDVHPTGVYLNAAFGGRWCCISHFGAVLITPGSTRVD
jgi:hypothetical protein